MLFFLPLSSKSELPWKKMERLFQAIWGRQAAVADKIIRSNLTLDVNWKSENQMGWAALHYACEIGFDSVISVLLDHPAIEVNQEDDAQWTPFFRACFNGHTSCVRLLLKDFRVRVNDPEAGGGHTPLWHAASHGSQDIIKRWIASGREMDLGQPGNRRTDVIGAAKEHEKTGVATLLERFKSDASKTRHEIRGELGWYDDLAAEMFALVVFVSDGLLQIKDTKTTTPAARFFSIARRLPLELQMVLCRRVVGSDKEIIPSKDSEVAFKELVRVFW